MPSAFRVCTQDIRCLFGCGNTKGAACSYIGLIAIGAT